MAGRALHFVFKVAERTKTIKFYRELLGMKVLRHEEFTQGCEAACNGPYDNRWSKTMVGYGPEDTHFVIELTYNYGVEDYKLGNDFLGITLKSSKVLENAKTLGWPVEVEGSLSYVVAPGGYKFYVIDEPQPVNKDPVVNVMLSSTNLIKSKKFWNEILSLSIFTETETFIELGFDEKQAKLKFRDIGEPINHATAYGRIAFSVPTTDLKNFQEKAQNNQYKILTPFVTLDTPGKASVSVVIFADPDGHEICFVGDKEFRELSQFDPDAEKQLDKYIKKDEARKLKN
ncbi:glyoxalase domain-containing protein 4 [Sipha flava]|uniref:Glyoxalase domain-containing protein 4 n=1 Tax=Sipha flava TaxID=143950 RepID=A0A2S2PYZ4_9HEMI|nr:glyoxalase domain-containing protein 4 [Sipha flava]XP_025405758.1 glyoxalase domain-containing protein 4 [Sipha flava]XP_025405759.1 glyoxalase domain-containing protein 4 [Sipha flava]XP_025405760.1 glyoxalase domain-containing protein 4 [Sipha flava]XP_025405762.1 glyoxalase domain-containing protein 4 [Sipha flava]